MSIELLREVLGWCTVINFGILLWWWLWIWLAHDFVYRLHSRWFRIDVERFDAIHYGGIAAYKLAIILFNAVPWLALVIVGD